MFNQAQKEAISHINGPAIVLAGPGSGKTTVITHRIKNLISNGISSENIMVVTFTKAAAVHMQKKFFSIMEGENWVKGSYPVSFGTFHSIYYRILRLAADYKGDNIITGRMQSEIIKEIALRKRVETGSMTEFIQSILGEIGNVKGNMVDLHDYEPKCCKKEIFSLIFNEYERRLGIEGKIDFDDILLKCYRLLCERNDILNRWQNIFQYILIDEFQDINTIQYEVVKMLAMPQNNIFIVGDDDQSVYGFRGACPEIMKQFTKDFREAKQIVMNINYRSDMEIVTASEKLIKNNKKRFKKNIVSNSMKPGVVEIRQFENQNEELSFMSKKIIEYINQGICAEDIAVLVRNNSQIPDIIDTLRNMQIASDTKNFKNNIYKGKVAEDIISYVKAALSYNQIPVRDNESLIKIINKPQRFIGRQVISDSPIGLEQLKDVYRHNREILNNIKQLQFHLDMIVKLCPSAAVTYIKNGTGYEKYLRQYADEHKLKLSALIRQIDEISSDSYRYDTLEQWVEAVENNTKKQINNKNKGINIMTMHGSKGLEFKIVFIVDANQGIIPTSKALRERDFEEERRVFYVAMTRAAEVLCVYGIAESLGCEMQMSMYAKEIIC